MSYYILEYLKSRPNAFVANIVIAMKPRFANQVSLVEINATIAYLISMQYIKTTGILIFKRYKLTDRGKIYCKGSAYKQIKYEIKLEAEIKRSYLNLMNNLAPGAPQQLFNLAVYVEDRRNKKDKSDDLFLDDPEYPDHEMIIDFDKLTARNLDPEYVEGQVSTADFVMVLLHRDLAERKTHVVGILLAGVDDDDDANIRVAIVAVKEAFLHDTKIRIQIGAHFHFAFLEYVNRLKYKSAFLDAAPSARNNVELIVYYLTLGYYPCDLCEDRADAEQVFDYWQRQFKITTNMSRHALNDLKSRARLAFSKVDQLLEQEEKLDEQLEELEQQLSESFDSKDTKKQKEIETLKDQKQKMIKDIREQMGVARLHQNADGYTMRRANCETMTHRLNCLKRSIVEMAQEWSDKEQISHISYQ